MSENENTDLAENQLFIKDIRLSFPVLFVPEQFGKTPKPDDPYKYSATFLIPKDHEAVEEIKEALRVQIAAKWKAKPGGVQFCLRDGAEKSHIDGCGPDIYMLSTSADADSKPQVYDADTSPISGNTGRIYGGCQVNAIVSFWAQDNSWGKRINANLIGVQFAGDGEPFGAGKVNAGSIFQPVAGVKPGIATSDGTSAGTFLDGETNDDLGI